VIAYAPATGTFRTPGGRTATMHYRQETNDANTLTASLDQDEYGLPSGMSGVAVDVGGYLGSVGIALALDNPEMRVVIIEPVPDNFELIIANAQANGVLGQVSVRQGAVGKGHEPVEVWYRYQGSVSLDHHAFVGNSSLAYDNGGEAQHETISYRATSLADLRDELGHIDFLKIDCEGGEWAFFSDGAKGVGIIVGEAHAVRGYQGRDIVGLLADTHDVILSGDMTGTCEFRGIPR
jgi:FkbM family methyltransferase